MKLPGGETLGLSQENARQFIQEFFCAVYFIAGDGEFDTEVPGNQRDSKLIPGLFYIFIDMSRKNFVQGQAILKIKFIFNSH